MKLKRKNKMNIILQLLLVLGGIVITGFFWIFVIAWAFTMNGWNPQNDDANDSE